MSLETQVSPAAQRPEPTLSAVFRTLYGRLSQGQDYSILLDSAGGPSQLNQWSIIGLYPKQAVELYGERLCHTTFTEGGKTQHVVEHPILSAHSLFGRLKELSSECVTYPEEGLPFQGGWLGVVGYGFYPWCDPGLRQTAPLESETFAALHLVGFEDFLLLDHQTGGLSILSPNKERAHHYRQAWETACQAKETVPTAKDGPSLSPAILQERLQAFESSYPQAQFEAHVQELLQHIENGEIYQANLSVRFAAPLDLVPMAVYETLCQRNPSAFNGIFNTPKGILLSNSPERLVQMDHAGHLSTRPIAGTRGRGETQAEDDAIGQALRQDPKEQAEHLMLVDLLRNDLGRVSQAGSVAVDELMTLERYSHVTHLVSNVIGTKRDEVEAWDVLKSVFPGGTITGCPKIRCIEILKGLEPVSRGWYTGSLGYLDTATGAMDWNILIRSLFLTPEGSPGGEKKPADLNALSRYNTAVHVGAGIVADSVAPHEYKECLRKAMASLGALPL